jgi:hypothetical protein
MSSASSTRSWSSPASQSTRKAKKPKARTQSQTFSDCGRHSNKWLFNDVSITSKVKKIFER